jgi:uncharacterized membrane protein
MASERPNVAHRRTFTELLLEHGLWIRWAFAFAGGIVIALLTPDHWPGDLRFLVAWDISLLIALSLPWWIILRSNSLESRLRARETDPGNAGLLLISVLVSLASIIGVVFVLAEKTVASSRDSFIGNALVVCAIFGGWALLQTAFTLHYAKVYYSDGAIPDGLMFPGGAPDDLDFAYFAFGIGVAGQVSDVSTTNQRMRRLVLVHSILSFVYNLSILGLMVNLLAGRL